MIILLQENSYGVHFFIKYFKEQTKMANSID